MTHLCFDDVTYAFSRTTSGVHMCCSGSAMMTWVRPSYSSGSHLKDGSVHSCQQSNVFILQDFAWSYGILVIVYFHQTNDWGFWPLLCSCRLITITKPFRGCSDHRHRGTTNRCEIVVNLRRACAARIRDNWFPVYLLCCLFNFFHRIDRRVIWAILSI